MQGILSYLFSKFVIFKRTSRKPKQNYEIEVENGMKFSMHGQNTHAHTLILTCTFLDSLFVNMLHTFNNLMGLRVRTSNGILV